MILQSCFLTSLLAITALGAKQAEEAQVSFPISNAQCPLLPQPATSSAVCGPYTYRYCDTPTADCAFCGGTALTLTEYTGYDGKSKDYVVDVEDYAFYHILNTEYLVEFSKNPMPFEERIDLPYCGINPDYNRELEARSLDARGGFKIGGSVGKAWEGAKESGKKFLGKVEKGAASIAAPFFQPAPKPPKFLPRPVCLPKKIAVPVHFTVFTTNISTSRMVDTWVLEKQIQLTNQAYEPLNISFFISSINYHIGREWERFTHHKANPQGVDYLYYERVKAENRYGGNDEANIWIVEQLDEVTCQGRDIKMGYCSFARELTKSKHDVDGCLIVMDALPGIAWRSADAGAGSTLTHELGHWFDLPHVFPDTPGGGCKGDSDLISDTFQFPNDDDMWDGQQAKCCTAGGKKPVWDYCSDKKLYNVTNYMSYSEIRGQVIPGNSKGAMPWTKGQRAHMYSTYFMWRRNPGAKSVTCNDYPVFFSNGKTTTRRDLILGKRDEELAGMLHGAGLLRSGEALMDQLITLCSSPPNQNTVQEIDIKSGEVVQCDKDGNCQPPSTGLTCYDGSAPPCRIDQVCPDGSAPPCSPEKLCSDGTTPPCTDNGGNTCPNPVSSCGLPPGTGGGYFCTCTDGSMPICDKNKDPNENDPNKNKDPTKDPNKDPNGNKDPIKDPNTDPNKAICPAGCNVHSNNCHKTTAPSCVYPDPRVAKPRAACACRPGFKASSYADTDTTKQWRLPIPGQEHRVWVAEGVECDKPCTIPSGFNSCREVSAVAKECAGY